ncbi:pyridoxamine 5'-phosphate oxidase [Motilibacter rhizosphaerae]|uniref:Pyridoxamine 5'-phosphate oxidase n=1 Tax=Motilibacter rhizosphaerae TaxID=598652 RepID=A0A4V2F4R4_9ACTN|nr:pyridoxamine 5'-phosphate oxidase family protein [Motilibacter rhizosphaerae]RZS90229.1 pyridoxamine 5'-phosphate oxidase [Motilibacter rhizosphaerae]
MTTWTEFAAAEPALAAAARERFAVRKHATMATLRADGSPRISGTEVEFDERGLVLGSMSGALKARDLQRDPRVAVHSPTVDPAGEGGADWPGEAKVAGVARELPGEHEGGAHVFVVELTEVVVTDLDGGLRITSWHPGRGVEVRHRS